MRRVYSIFKKHWAGALLITLGCAATALVVSVMQTPLYQSSSRILILQKNDGGIDAYTLARSSEKLGNNLSTIIGTSAFFNKVVNAGMIASADFTPDEAERRKEWQRIVSASLVPDSSILEIRARYPDRDKAERIVVAIESVLLRESPDFLGLPRERIFMQVVDAPLTSVRPVGPLLPMNTAAGALIGLMVAYGYALAREALAAKKKTIKEERSRMPLTNPVPAISRLSAHDRADDSPLAAMKVREEKIAPLATSKPSNSERIHTMFDDVKQPFGNQYFFENRIIELNEERI